MSEFKREVRYTVIKHNQLTEIQMQYLKNCIFGEGIPTVEAVVVESDWPEYQPVWKMIEDRVSGAPVEGGKAEYDALAQAMTTNQTIDGVSRKSLEQALKLAAVFDDGGDGAGAESARGVVWILRALLDAPACKRCNGSGWIDNLRQVGTQAMDCPDCKSATQLTNAQRRAADYKEQQAFNDWAWNKEGEAIGRMDGQAAAIEAWHARAKLAEQPAPVAVASRDESIYWLKRIDGIGQARAELIYSMGFRRHTEVPQS